MTGVSKISNNYFRNEFAYSRFLSEFAIPRRIYADARCLFRGLDLTSPILVQRISERELELPTSFPMVFEIKSRPFPLRRPFKLSTREEHLNMKHHQTWEIHSWRARSFSLAKKPCISTIYKRSIAMPIILHSAILRARAVTRIFVSPFSLHVSLFLLKYYPSNSRCIAYISLWCYARDIGISLYRISNVMYIPPEVCVSSNCSRMTSRVEPPHSKNDYDFFERYYIWCVTTSLRETIYIFNIFLRE